MSCVFKIVVIIKLILISLIIFLLGNKEIILINLI